MVLSQSEVRSYLMSAGFTGSALNEAVQISFCESSFDTEAHNTWGEDSRGLMQINLNAHPVYSSLDLFDPALNTLIAHDLYIEAGSSFRDWTCARQLGFVPGVVPKKEKSVFYVGLAFILGIVLYLT